MCLLSVIIPVYNAADYLDECIFSILSSVGKNNANVEILLIDDGSTDNSGNICAKYAEQEGNVHVFSKENGGVASARNWGLKHATGKYIAWVDPDDCVALEWFSDIQAAVSQNEPDVIVIDTIRFGSDSNKQEIYGRPGGLVDRDIFVEDVMQDIRMLSGLPNKIMKTALFQDVEFDEALTIMEDYAAMPQILQSAQSVYYIPKCLYFYRQHQESLLHRKSAESGFLSVNIALKREQSAEPAFHRAAVTASAWQAFIFCRNHYLDAGFNAKKEHLAFCRRYIRRHLGFLIADDIPRMLKLKMCLLGFGLYKIVCSVKKKRKLRNMPERKIEDVQI